MQSKTSLSLSRGHPAWAKKARSLANEFFVVRTIVAPLFNNEPLVRYGIVVKKKLGGAVLRNRIKRRIRAAFFLLDQSRIQTTESVSYIVVVRQAAVAELPFSGMCDYLKDVLKFYA